MNWLAHFFGFYNSGGNGSHYLFWSGAGSDLGELAIVGGIFGLIRHKNCHVHRCFRLGRHPVEGTPFTVCRKHHPDDHVTAEDVHAAHAAAKAKPARRKT